MSCSKAQEWQNWIDLNCCSSLSPNLWNRPLILRKEAQKCHFSDSSSPKCDWKGTYWDSSSRLPFFFCCFQESKEHASDFWGLLVCWKYRFRWVQWG